MRGNLVRLLVALAGGALVLVGCIESKATLTVNPDGSGTLEQTLYIKQQEGQDAKELTVEKVKENCTKGAAQLGEGVTLASVAAAEPRPKWNGFKITYNVADISKLKVGYLPPMGGGKADPDELMTFQFKPGQLTIVRPPLKVGEEKEGGKDDDAAAAAAFEGANIEFHLRVKGAITTTNAEHVNADKTGLLLFREDLGGLLKDKQALAIAKAMGKIKDPAELRAKLKDATLAKYVQMQSEDTVTIEFK
ncbi:MAG: hypothetical protein FJ291_02195 [Planctomycetes bacterium]|nr:hypothetical protein [Planctomycetota bacterium]